MKLPVRLTGWYRADRPRQAMLGEEAGDTQSGTEMEAQLQSGAVLWRIMRAEEGEECCGDQVRRLMR